MKNDKFISSVCFVRKYGHVDENGNQLEISKLSFENQIELNHKYNLPATYLLQYDALIDDYYKNTVMNEYKNHDAETGIWFEVVKPLAENAGIEWRGRDGRVWDHFVNPGFLMAYTFEEKKKLIDTFMQEFKEIYGFYPKTIGSWLIDSESMEYMSRKYAPDAFIICREQWGMDGYTLWGGPYYGAYYPSRNNMQTPAQNIENQINTPVFRMYVNDPIYCYYEYANMKYNDIDYGLFTQEPAWMCGQNAQWIKWHYENTFKDGNIGIKYTQLGQENCFGWKKIEPGHEQQIKYATQNFEKYGYKFIKFSEMGKSFKQEHKMTPPMMRYVLDDWAEKGNKSVWYNSSRYRINIFSDKENVWIRDIHIFDDDYRDKYLDNPCTTSAAIYDNLPIMDGIRFSSETERAGIYFGNGQILDVEDDTPTVEIMADNRKIHIILNEKNIEIISDNDFEICYTVGENCKFVKGYSTDRISFVKDEYKYYLKIMQGQYDGGAIKSESGKIVLDFSVDGSDWCAN